MTIVSMTGFARADGQHDGASWHWEVKSVNGKALDIRTRLPAGMDYLEAKVREIGAARLRRGNVQVGLQMSRGASASELRLNEEAAGQAITIAEILRRKLGSGPVAAEALLNLRGVVEVIETELDDEARTARDDALLASLEQAFDQLLAVRKAEGARIRDVIAGQVEEIARLAGAARDNPSRRPEVIREKLRAQIETLTGASPALDPDRLHQEALLLATKADIQEEIDRLFAHVEAARDLMADRGPVGRRLDFLAQEFNREANTVCSKAQDGGLTRIGLDLKTVIDQWREQVQNIE